MKNVPGAVGLIGFVMFVAGVGYLGLHGEAPLTKRNKYISIFSIIIGIILVILWGRQPSK